MSTLHDLRATLDRHADGLDDTARLERAAAVRGRVRVARRRRAAATGVAATVVVAGVGAVASIQAPRAPEVVAPTVVGVAVPEEIAVHDFPYELSGRDPFGGGVDRLRLDAGDEWRAVSLVGSGLGSGSATLYVDGSAVARVFAGDPIGVPVPVPPSDVDVVLRVDLHDTPAGARAGVATYDATGGLAPGVDNGTAVFRDTVAGNRLLAAEFSEQGDASATLSFRSGTSTTMVTSYCRTEEKGLWLQVVLDGDLTSRGACGDSPDPDAFGSSFSGGDTTDGPHTVEARVTRGDQGEVVPDAAVELGVAAYESGPTVRVAGIDVTEVVEHAGRTWRLDVDQTGVRLEIEAETDVLVGFVADGRWVQATWRGDLASGATGFTDVRSGGPATMVDGLLLAGDTYDVELVTEGGEPVVDGTLLVYRPE